MKTKNLNKVSCIFLLFFSQQSFSQTLSDIWIDTVRNNDNLYQLANQHKIEKERLINSSDEIKSEIYINKDMFKNESSLKNPALKSQESIYEQRNDKSVKEFNLNIKIPIYNPRQELIIKEQEILSDKTYLEEKLAKQHLSLLLIDRYLTTSLSYLDLKEKKTLLDKEEKHLTHKNVSKKDKAKIDKLIMVKKENYLLSLENYKKKNKDLNLVCNCSVSFFPIINEGLLINHNFGSQEEWLNNINSENLLIRLGEVNLNSISQKIKIINNETAPTINLIGQKTFQENYKLSSYASSIFNEPSNFGLEIKIPLFGGSNTNEKKIISQKEVEARNNLNESFIILKDKTKEKWTDLNKSKEELINLTQTLSNFDFIKNTNRLQPIETNAHKLKLIQEINTLKHRILLDYAYLNYQSGKLDEDIIYQINKFFIN